MRPHAAVAVALAVALAAVVPTRANLLSPSEAMAQEAWMSMETLYWSGYSDWLIPLMVDVDSCEDRWTNYSTLWDEAGCANMTSASCSNDNGNDVCCIGPDVSKLNDNWCSDYYDKVVGADDSDCCSICSGNENQSGYDAVCTLDGYLTLSVCETEMNRNGTLPMPQDYDCSTSGTVTLTGQYSLWNDTADRDFNYWSNHSCDLLDSYVTNATYANGAVAESDYYKLAIDMFDTINDDDYNPRKNSDQLYDMSKTNLLLFRPGVAGGAITFAPTVWCSVIIDAQLNGEFSSRGGDNSDLRLFSPYVYDTAPPLDFKNGNVSVAGGVNHGEIDFDGSSVNVAWLNNYGNVSFVSANGFVADVSNEGVITAIDTLATLINVTNTAQVSVYNSAFNVYNVSNSGTVFFYDSTATVVGGTNDATIYVYNTASSRRRLAGAATHDISIDGIANNGDLFAVGDGSTVAEIKNTVNYAGNVIAMGLQANLTNLVNTANFTIANGTFKATGLVNSGVFAVYGDTEVQLEFTENTGTIYVAETVSGSLSAPSGGDIIAPDTVDVVSDDDTSSSNDNDWSDDDNGSDDDGMDTMWIIIICVGALVVVAGGVCALMLPMKKNKVVKSTELPQKEEGEP